MNSFLTKGWGFSLLFHHQSKLTIATWYKQLDYVLWGEKRVYNVKKIWFHWQWRVIWWNRYLIYLWDRRFILSETCCSLFLPSVEEAQIKGFQVWPSYHHLFITHVWQTLFRCKLFYFLQCCSWLLSLGASHCHALPATEHCSVDFAATCLALLCLKAEIHRVSKVDREAAHTSALQGCLILKDCDFWIIPFPWKTHVCYTSWEN